MRIIACSGQPYLEMITSWHKMTVAVNMSRNDLQGNGTANTGHTRGKQAKWIRDVRSGPWQVTMLENRKGHTRCTITFGLSNVEIMRRQVSN